MADEPERQGPPIPRGWQRHPRERMLITPLMAGHRGPARLLHGRLRRRLAADSHLRPAALERLGATLERRPQGAQPVRLERLLRLPLRLFAAAGCPRGALLPLPEGLAAGRLLGLRPVAEPARHRAHGPRPLAGVGLASAGLAASALLRPPLHGPAVADAGHEVALLGPAVGRAGRVRRGTERQVRPAPLRGARSTASTWCSSTRASHLPTGASRARTSRSWRRPRTA